MQGVKFGAVNINLGGGGRGIERRSCETLMRCDGRTPSPVSGSAEHNSDYGTSSEGGALHSRYQWPI